MRISHVCETFAFEDIPWPERIVEFHEMDPYPLIVERIDFIVKHWRTNADDTDLEWIPCGPDCTHMP